MVYLMLIILFRKVRLPAAIPFRAVEGLAPRNAEHNNAQSLPQVVERQTRNFHTPVGFSCQSNHLQTGRAFIMASVPTIRIGYVPGMSSTELDRALRYPTCYDDSILQLDMVFLRTKETDWQCLRNPRALSDSSTSGLALSGRILPPIQDRPDSVPIRHGPYDHIAARQ